MHIYIPPLFLTAEKNTGTVAEILLHGNLNWCTLRTMV